MDTNNKEQINSINLEKVESVVDTINTTPSPISLTKREPLFSPVASTAKSPIFSKKVLITLGVLVALLVLLTFVFKDKLFKKADTLNQPKQVTPEDYKKAVEQSFQDGYKVDYQYDEGKMEAAVEVMQKQEKKVQSEPKVEETKMMLKNINN